MLSPNSVMILTGLAIIMKKRALFDTMNSLMTQPVPMSFESAIQSVNNPGISSVLKVTLLS